MNEITVALKITIIIITLAKHFSNKVAYAKIRQKIIIITEIFYLKVMRLTRTVTQETETYWQ